MTKTKAKAQKTKTVDIRPIRKHLKAIHDCAEKSRALIARTKTEPFSKEMETEAREIYEAADKEYEQIEIYYRELEPTAYRYQYRRKHPEYQWAFAILDDIETVHFLFEDVVNGGEDVRKRLVESIEKAPVKEHKKLILKPKK